MKFPLCLRLLLVVGFLSQASCRDGPIAPKTSEVLPVTVQTRAAASGETVPTVRLSGGSGSLTVRVTRGAMCGTIVTAGVNRELGELAIVARVSDNPRLACIGQYLVVDYEGTITSLRGGRYQVRIFESVTDGKPQLISSGMVTVLPPA
jgi:hypothetical protein